MRWFCSVLVAMVFLAGCTPQEPTTRRTPEFLLDSQGGLWTGRVTAPTILPEPKGHPNRFHLERPCDTPEGTFLPR